MLKRSLAVLMVVVLAASGCAQLRDRLQNPTEGGPGSNYESYLGGGADTLLVELDHSPGAKWDTSQRVDEQFKQEVQRITDKRVVVETSRDLPGKGEDYAYSSEELRQLHRDHQDFQSGNGTVVMHALFLDGDYGGNVAGLAFDADAFALFKGTISEQTCSNDALTCTGGVREWKVTRSVAIHEAGHLFGLVNSPLPMVTPHEMTQDPKPDTPKNEGKAHSTNEDSVMYWKVENTGGLASLIGGGEVPWEFDSNDMQDARAVR